MAGSTISIEVKDEGVKKMFGDALNRLKNLLPLMKIFGQVVVTSVRHNFEQSGRPAKWAPNSPVTLARKKGRRILIGKGGQRSGLLGSIHSQPESFQVRVGTDKIYGAVQQFGAARGAFGQTKRGAPIPWGNIPGRPFIMVQPEDWTEMTKEGYGYITK